jgi:hypothetical protein
MSPASRRTGSSSERNRDLSQLARLEPVHGSTVPGPRAVLCNTFIHLPSVKLITFAQFENNTFGVKTLGLASFSSHAISIIYLEAAAGRAEIVLWGDCLN